MGKEILKDKGSYLEFTDFKDVEIYFTTNVGGKSLDEFKSNNMAYQVGDKFESVLENRKNFSDKINANLDDFVFANQTHSINIHKVVKEDKGRGKNSFEDGIENTDVLYTYEKNIPLCLFYADCTPIYFVDKTIGLVGIIHSGWQGTYKNIIDETIKVLKKRENINPGNLKFVIGPSIKKGSFEVQEDVYDLFKDSEYAQGGVIVKNIKEDNNISWNIDLVEYTKNALLKNGVHENNIFISNIDTVSTSNMYSFRRDNKTGRMIGVIIKK